jgi:hypothetical protein
VSVTALSSASLELPMGDVWPIAVWITDNRCATAVDPAPVLTVTPPTGSPAAVTLEFVSTGVYRADVPLTLPGRYTARVSTAVYGVATFAAQSTDVGAVPTIDDLDTYLGGDTGHSFTDDDLQDALDAEAAAQRRVCRVPAEFDPDLRQALLRRCAVNLAKRRLPLMVLQGDADAGTASANVPGKDAEVRRLEGPWRRLAFGRRSR